MGARRMTRRRLILLVLTVGPTLFFLIAFAWGAALCGTAEPFGF